VVPAWAEGEGTMSVRIVEYRRIHHAAHDYFTGEPLHDLSQWTVDGGKDVGPPQIDRVEHHHGFVRDGQQFSVWVRREIAHPAKCGRTRACS
jgi:hypothetical protein